MRTATINIPKRTFIDILRAQPEHVITEIFEQIMVKFDNSPLTESEIEDLEKARKEYKKGETIAWSK